MLSTLHETKDLATQPSGYLEHLEHVERLHETKDLATQPPWANTQSSLRDPRQAKVGWSCWERTPSTACWAIFSQTCPN